MDTFLCADNNPGNCKWTACQEQVGIHFLTDLFVRHDYEWGGVKWLCSPVADESSQMVNVERKLDNPGAEAHRHLVPNWHKWGRGWPGSIRYRWKLFSQTQQWGQSTRPENLTSVRPEVQHISLDLKTYSIANIQVKVYYALGNIGLQIISIYLKYKMIL